MFCCNHNYSFPYFPESVFCFTGNNIEDDDFSVSTLLEKANANLGMHVI